MCLAYRLSTMSFRSRAATVASLGTTQTLAWASSYYLPAMLAGPIARDVGVSVSTIFAAFSLALIVSAIIGPLAGRAIDQYGGRPVLIATNVIFAAGLGGLAWAEGPTSVFACWALIGVGMGAGLYEAAFATLVRLYGHESRASITGITLIAGFASTVGWPLSAWLETQVGWRGACMAWATLHLVVGVPLNFLLPRATRAVSYGDKSQRVRDADQATPSVPGPHRDRAFALLATVFAITWFISTAMAAHLPRLLQEAGATLTAAVAASALVGPAQVAARLLEFGLLRRVHPVLSAQLAALAHPLGAGVLAIAGAPFAAAFTVLHGAGNGILTIAKGTLPLVLFGPHAYGARQGLLMVPARIAQAFAPFLFGLFIDHWGLGALWVSAALGVTAFAALLWLSDGLALQLRVPRVKDRV